MLSRNYRPWAILHGHYVRVDIFFHFMHFYLSTRHDLERRRVLSHISSISNKYYTSRDLRHLSHISPWDNIYANLSNRAFLSFLNLDVRTFYLLHNSFKYYFDKFSPYSTYGHRFRGGVKRRLPSHTCLALVLNYFNTIDKLRVLQVSFLLPPSTCSLYLNFGLRCLSLVIDICIGRAVGSCPKVSGFKIEFPKEEATLENYHQSLVKKYPRLTEAKGKVFGFLDGTKVC